MLFFKIMIKRRFILSLILKWLDRDEIIIISGPRRTGKTTLLYMIREELLKKRIPEKNIFMLNLEDIDVLQELRRSPKALLKYIIDENKKNYFLIDEIQYLEEPTNFLKYLYDMHRNKVKLIVTGSYLFELKGQFRDSLVGRKVQFRLSPLTFAEYVDFKDEELLPYLSKTEIPGSIHNDLLTLLEEYLVYGGMPEVVLTDDIEIKKTLLKEYVNTYLRKDIRYISGSNDILRYNDLLSILAGQISGLLNIQEICNTLGMSHAKVKKYLEHFILSSVVYFVPPFYTNVRTQISKMRKIFLFDIGIRNQIIQNFSFPAIRNDAGALFENFLFNELINLIGQENIFYYRTKVGAEIDFIIRREKIIPVEVKYKKLKKPVGIKALKYFIEKNKIDRGYLVNLTLNQIINNGKIEAVDFVRFVSHLKRL